MENDNTQSTEAVTIENTQPEEWNFHTHTKYLNEIGHQYPREFIVDMYDNAFSMVRDWLKENAPAEIFDIMEDGQVLELNARIDRLDNSKGDMSEYPEMFQRITAMAYKTGHSFQFPC